MAGPDSLFLGRCAEAAFTLGLDGFLVSTLSVPARSITFRASEQPAPPPVYEQGEPPVPGPAGRRTDDWQPAADAPLWMNTAWLLDDLAASITPLAEDQVQALGLEAPPGADWCDLSVRDGDSLLRVRIQLAGRREPLEFPGMFLRELFTEGRYRDHLAAEPDRGVPVVDLRGTL
ncbi:hypothetical protein [Streptomyces boluensis]|uniref:Uncharacterized protein n=1 Tax=Streptomyces boluensis TaxID=1775135 RepID=A0A964UWQ4_9ACTN|nr:hypothetical protein [Streptomyces boluensis]NBE55921.1 hypothetical protein [Streptomyces boluensis]